VVGVALLPRLAGLHHAAVICEIMNRDGSMARGSDLAAFCSKHGFTMVTVAQLDCYRLETESNRSLDTHPSEAFEHGADWKKVSEENNVHQNSSIGDGYE
jgi:hypothetical protein